jgi:hypothetical protein
MRFEINWEVGFDKQNASENKCHLWNQIKKILTIIDDFVGVSIPFQKIPIITNIKL